jgi:hypothetical protein
MRSVMHWTQCSFQWEWNILPPRNRAWVTIWTLKIRFISLSCKKTPYLLAHPGRLFTFLVERTHWDVLTNIHLAELVVYAYTSAKSLTTYTLIYSFILCSSSFWFFIGVVSLLLFNSTWAQLRVRPLLDCFYVNTDLILLCLFCYRDVLINKALISA